MGWLDVCREPVGVLSDYGPGPLWTEEKIPVDDDGDSAWPVEHRQTRELSGGGDEQVRDR
ncbi:hypothetical protein IDVR_34230 [Intrasporangium sp. DVR]